MWGVSGRRMAMEVVVETELFCVGGGNAQILVGFIRRQMVTTRFCWLLGIKRDGASVYSISSTYSFLKVATVDDETHVNCNKV